MFILFGHIFYGKTEYFHDLVFRGDDPTYRGFKFSYYLDDTSFLMVHYRGDLIANIYNSRWYLRIKFVKEVIDNSSIEERMELTDRIREAYEDFYKFSVDYHRNGERIMREREAEIAEDIRVNTRKVINQILNKGSSDG
jgi:hypothetical protein